MKKTTVIYSTMAVFFNLTPFPVHSVALKGSVNVISRITERD